MARQNQNRQDGQVARESGRALRLAAMVAVAIGLAALTAGACVLSYEHIQHLALQSGVSTRMANIYPLILDALLVLAGCSVLALRGAGLGSRIYAWLCMLVLLAGLAAGGAVHAAGVRFSRKGAGIAAAVLPWLLVLIGFGLLLALLRYARQRRLANRAAITEHQAEPLQPEVPDVVLTGPRSAPAPASRPAATPGSGSGRGADTGASNPALAALATARSHTEPATAPQPAVVATGPGPASAGATSPGHAGPGPASSGSADANRGPVIAPPRAASGSQSPAPSGSAGLSSPAPGTPGARPAEPVAAGSGTPGPGAPGPNAHSPADPAGADLTKPAPRKLPVRQADLQLRARIPRPASASGGPPSAAAGAMHAGSRQNPPFTPRVGAQQPPAALPQQPPANAQGPDMPPQPPAQDQLPGQAQPTAVPQQPPAGAQPPAPAQPAASSQPAAETGDAPASTDARPDDKLSAAPTETADDGGEEKVPSGLPWFRRQRSSPTPPDEE